MLTVKPDVVETLCAAGASVDFDAKLYRGETPLYVALWGHGNDNERLEIVKTLCKNGADVSAYHNHSGRSMLYYAENRTKGTKGPKGNEFCDVLKQYGAIYSDRKW